MHFFYDLLPIILFFVAFKLYGIYAATIVAVVAVLTQVATTAIRGKKPEMMQLITLGMVIVLGGATLFFKNELFIKWKPTAVYWVLGAVLGIAAYLLFGFEVESSGSAVTGSLIEITFGLFMLINFRRRNLK